MLAGVRQVVSSGFPQRGRVGKPEDVRIGPRGDSQDLETVSKPLPISHFALFTGLFFAGLLACGRQEPPRRIVLVSLDTFRADLLDATWPDGRPMTPNLRALAAKSRRYDRAFAPMPFTLPSHMTMVTGMHPESHYVVTKTRRLAEGIPTLAETLRRQGYRTAGIVSSSWVKGSFGFDRGFDSWQEISEEALSFVDQINALATPEIEASAKTGERLFLFLHYYDAHSEFGAQGNRLSYYSPPELRADLTIGPEDLCNEQARCATDYLLWTDREGREVPPERIALHRELYRRGAAALDSGLGDLFAALAALDHAEDTLLIVTSDHGEEFREHDKFLHSQVFDETMRVPLLVHWPRLLPGSRSADLVALEDLMPTLLAAARAPIPATVEGIDLLAPKAAGSLARTHVSQDKLTRSRYGLRDDRYLLIWDFATREVALFDRLEDPEELEDLAPRRADLVEELRSRLFADLRALRQRRPELVDSEEAPFTEREQQVLRSLGYF